MGKARPVGQQVEWCWGKGNAWSQIKPQEESDLWPAAPPTWRRGTWLSRTPPGFEQKVVFWRQACCTGSPSGHVFALSHLSCGSDSLPDAEVADDPGKKEEHRQLPLDVSDLLDTRGHIEHPASGKNNDKNWNVYFIYRTTLRSYIFQIRNTSNTLAVF